ncbi:MAG: hypothetical protein ACTSW2_09795 [Alphaproteobacteria bacterium]
MSEEPIIPEQTEEKSGLRDILALLADGRSALQVSDIAIDDDGHIRLRNSDEALRFAFAYRGADFLAQVETTPEARITLSAEFGKVPYSMEQGTGRRVTQRIVEDTADLPGGRIEISKSQDMSLVATSQPPHPLTPASVMAAITSLLLDFRPYIDLLRETLVVANGQYGPVPASSSSPEPLPESSSEL